jgi:hypothetical protein
MKKQNEIEETLCAIAVLLEDAGESSWSHQIKALHHEFRVDSNTALPRIRAIFGGMGSFNDIVLHQKGAPLQEKNEKLAHHRARLFSLIHGWD